jgi:hypothetical protein
VAYVMVVLQIDFQSNGVYAVWSKDVAMLLPLCLYLTRAGISADGLALKLHKRQKLEERVLSARQAGNLPV